jgi:hypothetical protein
MTATEPTIRITCFNCGSRLRVPPEYVDKRCSCPKCHAKIYVPIWDETNSVNFGPITPPSGSDINDDPFLDSPAESTRAEQIQQRSPAIPPPPQTVAPPIANSSAQSGPKLGPARPAGTSATPPWQEPSIYRWVARWAKGLMWSSSLLSIGGLLYIISSWIAAHDSLQSVLQKEIDAGLHGSGPMTIAQATYDVSSKFFMMTITGIAFTNLLMLLVGGCALVLVDIGRTTRKAAR